MGLPMETVMKLPVQDRRYYIQRHNEEQAGIKSRRENGGDKNTRTFFDGETIKGKTAEELNAMFSKTYDASNKAGSNLYNDNKLRLQAKIYANSTTDTPILGEDSVIYSELYMV